MSWSLTVTLAAIYAKNNGMEHVSGIKMKPLMGYDYSLILGGEIRVEDVSNFAEMFPDIVRDRRPDWFLYGVFFQTDMLELEYVCRKSYPGRMNSVIYPTAYVKVRNPAKLGLKFDVPPSRDYPRRRYKLRMYRSTDGTERTLWLKEKYFDTGVKNKIKISSRPSQSK